MKSHAAAAAEAQLRADFGIHFRTQFPHGTTVLVEMAAGDDANGVASAAQCIVDDGLVSGIWLSTEMARLGAAADAASAELAACAAAVRARCATAWIGVRPRHLAPGAQFGFLTRKCPPHSGLWTDGLVADPSQPTDKRNGAARGVWQEVTTARALGKWKGLGFGMLHEDMLAVPRGAGKEPADHPARKGEDRLVAISAAASSVTDCVLVECCAGTPFVEQLVGLQRLRQALLAVLPAPATEDDLRGSVGAVAGMVDGIVIGRPAVAPEDLADYCKNLNGWLHTVLVGAPPPDPNGDGGDAVDGNALPDIDTRVAGEAVELQLGATAIQDGSQGGGEVPRLTGLDAHVAAVKQSGEHESLESMLGHQLRVEITDGRVVYGRLACTDHHQNLILCGSEEHGPASTTADGEPHPLVYRRRLGMVMVPGTHIVRAAVRLLSK